MIFMLFVQHDAFFTVGFCFIKIRVKNIYLQTMSLNSLWLVFTLQLIFKMSIAGSVDPVLMVSPYFQSAPVSIKQDLTTSISSSNPITKQIPFKKTYSQIPKLAYGIKNYRGNFLKYSATDRLGVQKFSIVKTALTTTSFTVFTELISYTYVRILSVFYFAVDKACPYHINAFHDLDVNYQAGPLVNISSTVSNIRTYRNVIKYANLAAQIGSSFNSFGADLTKNQIMLYISGLYEDMINNVYTVPFLYTLAIQVLSTTEFEISVAIYPEFLLERIKFSLVVVDVADLEKTNQITVVTLYTNLLGSTNNYVTVPQIFMDSAMFGFKDLKAAHMNCSIEFNLELEPSNNRIIFNQSIPAPQSNALCGLQTYNATIFYVMSYQCQLPDFPYFDTTSFKCQQIICGDSKWMKPNEACEDGNLNNNDGCSQLCTVETNFTCLPADQLANGLSLCKYTKNISLTLTQIANNEVLKTLHFYFKIDPTNYTSWNQTTIQALIGSIEITSQSDPLTLLVPSSEITVKFDPNSNPNQVQIIVPYNNQSIDKSFLNFTTTPSNTLNPSISHLQPLDYSINVDFASNVAPLSSISIVSESDQVLERISQMVGAFALILLLFGFFIPVGRLIVVQALAVIQISLFSILQLAKIPSSFTPLRFLILSTGYSDISKFSGDSATSKNVYKLMGLQSSIVANLNIGIILFALPFLIGGVGMIVTIILRSSKHQNQKVDEMEKVSTQRQPLFNKNNQQKLKNPKIEKATKPEFIKNIFKRIFNQSTLYGLLVCGYLMFVSIFNSFKEISTINIVLIVFMAGFWLLYSILLVKSNQNEISLNKFSLKLVNSSLKPKNGQFSTQFGEFREVHEQISGIKKSENFPLQKMYIIFMAERIIVSSLISVVSNYFAYSPLLITVIFLIMLVALNVSNGLYQKKLPDEKQKPLFSYLHKNYVLRQSINFVTIIIVEISFFAFQVLVLTKGEQTFFKSDLITLKVIPYMVLAILLANIFVNVVFLVCQVKESEIIAKAKVIISILFGGQFVNLQIQTQKLKPDSPVNKNHQTEKQSISNTETVQKQESVEEKQINFQLNNYVKGLVNNGLNQSIHKRIEKQPVVSKIDEKMVFDKEKVQTTKEKDDFHVRKPTEQIKWNFSPRQLNIKVLYGNPIYDEI